MFGESPTKNQGLVSRLVSVINRALTASFFNALPLLIYLKSNLGQVPAISGLKPFLAIFSGSVILFLLISSLLRSTGKASLVLIVLTLFVFTFGHLDALFHHTSALLVVYIVILAVLLFLIVKTGLSKYFSLPVFQFVTFGLLIFNLASIGVFEHNVDQREPSRMTPSSTNEKSNRPDIYYIVLDAYSRDDLLKERYAFDNSSFLDSLEERGFYLPACAWSNYDSTIDTITSVLNMDYLDALPGEGMGYRQLSQDKIRLLQDSVARQYFNNLDYQFVTTRGYADFNDIRDSDLYLDVTDQSTENDRYTQTKFLAMFLDTTILRAFALESNTQGSSGSFSELHEPQVNQNSTEFIEADYWYRQSRYVFDELSKLPEQPGSFLVYAHINAPHGPFVFTPEGEFRLPEQGMEESQLYIDSIKFLNQRVLELIDNLLENSDQPPIIILQSDHATHAVDFGVDKHKILSAYYLPGDKNLDLSNTITPVNNFRLVIHNYFDSSVDLLPDTLFINNQGEYRAVSASCENTP